jgi:hypothetical protein
LYILDNDQKPAFRKICAQYTYSLESQIWSANSAHIGVHHPGIYHMARLDFALRGWAICSFSVTILCSIWGNSDRKKHLHCALTFLQKIFFTVPSSKTFGFFFPYSSRNFVRSSTLFLLSMGYSTGAICFSYFFFSCFNSAWRLLSLTVFKRFTFVSVSTNSIGTFKFFLSKAGLDLGKILRFGLPKDWNMSDMAKLIDTGGRPFLRSFFIV